MEKTFSPASAGWDKLLSSECWINWSSCQCQNSLEFIDVKKKKNHICFQRRHWCISSNHWHLVQCWPFVKDVKQSESEKSVANIRNMVIPCASLRRTPTEVLFFLSISSYLREIHYFTYFICLIYLFASLDFTKEAHWCRCLQEMFAEDCKSKWRKTPCKFKQTCRSCVFHHTLGHTEVMNLLH